MIAVPGCALDAGECFLLNFKLQALWCQFYNGVSILNIGFKIHYKASGLLFTNVKN